MQNKGLIRFFAIIFAAVCIYQLTYTLITNNIENDAEAYAISIVDKDAPNAPSLIEEARKRYLDSISNKDVWGGYTTYASAKENELKKGLDLKGGINVILQISIRDLLIGMADGSTDGDFRTALDRADERIKDGQQDYFDYFIEEFEKIDGAQLASPDIFANQEMEGRINFDMSNNDVAPVLREELQSYMRSAFDVLRKRIDKFGTTQPNIQQLGSSGRILIEMPGEKDVKRVKQLLVGTALLEFWHVYKASEVAPYLIAADTYWADKIASEKNPAAVDTATVAVDTAVAVQTNDNTLEDLLNNNSNEVEDVAVVDQDQLNQNPILSRVLAPGNGAGPIIATFRASDQELIQKYLNDKQARGKLNPEQRFLKFAWGRPELNDELGYELIDLYALRANAQDEAPLSGGVITDAKQDYGVNNTVIVSMSMNSEGSKIWEQMTTEAFQNQTQVAVVLDNTVYSAPGINDGPISGGNSQISGNFTVADAEDLATVLKAGKLPAKAEIIQSEVIGPSLGQEAITAGLWSFAIALLLVLVWMFFYYGRAGLYADVALLVNILFIFGALASFGAVLTLPGIAGIVLTIGISVDANVLIFERIKEELAKGKSQADSIKDGFNNALSSILDANITTFLTAAILYIFGTGPIQGFATTLMIGILTSLFTAIFITRLFIDRYGKKGKYIDFTTAITKNWFTNVNIDFLKKRKGAYILSGVLIVASLVSLATFQLNLGIDFTGGRKYTVRFEQDMNATEVASILSDDAIFGSAEVKTYGADNQLAISTKYGIEMDDSEASADIESKLYNSLKQYLPADMSQEQFGDVSVEGKEYGIMSNFQVGPTIADDILTGSLYAIFGSLIVVFLYILIRFRRWQFSLGAVLAVFHDVIILLGIFSACYQFLPFNMEIDQAFIAAILTVIGYSLNDTVVVFDRIREFIAEKTNWDFNRTVNGAINSTISRTLNTSLTTLIVLLAIFSFGGESIRGFMFALIIGVVVGTYSSVFIATPIMFDTLRKSKARPRQHLADKEVEEVK